jgi:hypothetical protein
MKLLKTTFILKLLQLSINIVENWWQMEKINKSTYVICNGFKGTNTLKIFHV